MGSEGIILLRRGTGGIDQKCAGVCASHQSVEKVKTYCALHFTVTCEYSERCLGGTPCVCMHCGVLDCISCCSELICEIELYLHTAAPAAWHCVCVSVCLCLYVCVLLDGSSHGA